jgi:hypothetical protein
MYAIEAMAQMTYFIQFRPNTRGRACLATSQPCAPALPDDRLPKGMDDSPVNIIGWIFSFKSRFSFWLHVGLIDLLL